jgi:hypothetical protein
MESVMLKASYALKQLTEQLRQASLILKPNFIYFVGS